MPRFPVFLALLISAVAFSASDAFALRYASQTGSNAANCQTVATACSLSTAVGASTTTSEEIVVLPGNYAVATTINPTASDLHIHGAVGQPRPVITGGSLVQVFHGVNINLADLDIEGSGELLGISGGLFDRLLIRGTASGSVLCQCYDGTIRDSVLVVTGGLGGMGINSNGGNADETMVNDTFISTVSGTPAIRLMQVGSVASATIAYTAKNVIARNLAGGVSVQSDQQVAGQSTVLTLHHSDLGTIGPTSHGSSVVATDANITTAPLFANAAAGDFHVLAGSPTINKGIDDLLAGTLDYDGLARVVGTTDMGAFEFHPPVIPPVTTPMDPPVAPPDPPANEIPTQQVPFVPTLAPPKLTLAGHTFALAARASKLSVGALCAWSGAGKCTISGTLRAVLAVPAPKHAKPVTVGLLRGTLTAGRRGTLTLSLTAAALRVLRPKATGAIRRLSVALSAKVTAGAASRTLDTRLSISVKRPSVKQQKHSR